MACGDYRLGACSRLLEMRRQIPGNFERLLLSTAINMQKSVIYLSHELSQGTVVSPGQDSTGTVFFCDFGT